MPDIPKACELTILMPCLNEAETLGACIQKAQQFLQESGIDGEVLIADNGSTDGSQDIAIRSGARVTPVPLRGYGAALIEGIRAASGKYIIMGDADDSYDFTDLMPFVEKLRQGYDLVMGNRFRGAIRPGAMPFLHQYLGNPVLSGVGRLFFRSTIGDFHSGLRGFNREAIQELDLRTTGMEFASEMVVKATLFRLKITETPIILYPDGRSRPPHLRTWSDGWRHLRFLVLYSPRWLFLYPGLLLILFGFIFSGILLAGPLQIGNIELDVDTLLYTAISIVIGVQSVTFYTFTKVYGQSVGLLPEDTSFNRFLHLARLEVGLALGALLIIGGLVSSILALNVWRVQAFGNLDTTISMRLVIPGVTLFTLGFQVIFASFFLSILALKHR